MNSAKRPKDAGRTSADILEAAGVAFTRHGYDGVGIREIAAAVGVNASLINRYFGTKQALFERSVASAFTIQGLLDGSRETFGVDMARYVLTKNRQADGFDPTLAMLRSIANPSAAAVLRDALQADFVQPLSDWLGGAEAATRAGLIIAELSGLATMHDVLGLPALRGDEDRLIQRVGASLQAHVDG